MAENDFLTKEDFFELTGAQQPARVCQKLREEGIRFITRYDGWPSLTWEALYRQICNGDGRASSNTAEDDNFRLDRL